MILNIRTLKGLLSNMKLTGHNIPRVQARFEVIKSDEKCVTQIKRRYANSQSDQNGTSSNDQEIFLLWENQFKARKKRLLGLN